MVWGGMVLLCRLWRHCWRSGGSPAVLCDVVSVLASSCPVGVEQELVAAPGSLVVLLLMEPMATIPNFGVVAFIGLGSLESQGRYREPYPIVGGVIRLSRRAIFGWWLLHLSSPPGSPVLSAAWRRDDACSETVVPLLLAE